MSIGSMVTLGSVFMRMGGLLALSDFNSQFSNIASLLNLIGLLLCFAGLLMAAAMAMMGRMEMIKYGLIGAAIGGLAWAIVKNFFQEGSGSERIKTFELN